MAEILNEKMASLERDAEVCGSDEAVSEESNIKKSNSEESNSEEKRELGENNAGEFAEDDSIDDIGELEEGLEDEINVSEQKLADDVDETEQELADDIDETEQELANDIDETEQELADDLEVLRSSLSELSSLRSIDDLTHPEEYARFRSLGLTPREAYLATGERREPREPKRITAPMSVKRDRSAIPEYYLKMAREIFGGLSDREIQSLYKRVSRKS